MDTRPRSSMAAPALTLDQLRTAKAHMAACADDDVIVHRDAERFGSFHDGFGHLDVGLRGGGIARGMIVDQSRYYN